MKYLYILCLLLISENFFAQEVSNIHFEQTADKRIRIFYDLNDSFNNNSFFVQIYFSKDNGQNWSPPLKYVSGDIGEDQLAGVSKEIIWDVLKEEKSLSGNIKFKIDVFLNQIGFFIDKRDNQQYKWVKIGNMIWMAENLNYKSPKSWNYNNETGNNYGRLYSWKAAVNSCPKGWHLPTDNEWVKLTDQFGGATVSGRKIRAKYGWKNTYFKGSDKSHFSALPAGERKPNGIYTGEGNITVWWSSKEYQSSFAWSRSLGFDPDEVLRSYEDKSSGFSVRCVKD